MNRGELGRRLCAAWSQAAPWLQRSYGFPSIRIPEFLNTEKRFEVFDALLSGGWDTGATVGTNRRHFSLWNERAAPCI
jgi:hypothetical protein